MKPCLRERVGVGAVGLSTPVCHPFTPPLHSRLKTQCGYIFRVTEVTMGTTMMDAMSNQSLERARESKG